MDEGLVCYICGEYNTYNQIQDNIVPNDKAYVCICIKCRRPIEISKCMPYFLAKKDSKCTNCNNEIISDVSNKGYCSKCNLKYKIVED